MILCFDIGNTSTSAALFPDKGLAPAAVFRFPTIKDETHNDLGAHVREGLRDMPDATVTGVAFSSVAPELNHSYRAMAGELFGVTACEITCRSKLNFTIAYHDPAQLGADRIVNAAAVFHEYGGGAVVVDIGTAVTFCVLLEGGIFDGGVIAPGIDTTIRSLALRASRLPEVPFEKPDRVAARDTVNALKSGFYYGWLSLAEGIIARLEGEYGRSFRIILTGGYAGAVTGHLARAHVVDPLLALKGVKLIYDMNR